MPTQMDPTLILRAGFYRHGWDADLQIVRARQVDSRRAAGKQNHYRKYDVLHVIS
jgi:hypothetical protein